MNDTTENTENSGNKLQGAFGDRGTNVNAINYGHLHGDKILNEARQILLESPTGQILVKVWDHHRIPTQVMKGTGESGFSPSMNSIIIQVPGKTKSATGEVVINLARALRDADQEYSGLTAPDPMKDVMAYAGFIHARNLDSITHVCKIIKELTNSSFFSVLLDSLPILGLQYVYKAYLDGKPKEELYDYYADAYDNRGSI